MTLLQLKREAERLGQRELKELHMHLMRLRRSTPEWRKATAKKLRAVESGHYVTAGQIEKKIGGA